MNHASIAPAMIPAAETTSALPDLPPGFIKKMSLFESATRPVPQAAITTDQLIAMIREPSAGTLRTLQAAREALAAGDSEKYSSIKKSLPAVTFAGTFSKRSNAALMDHSHLMPIDLDHLDANALESARLRLAGDPHCVFFYVSPSGAGLKGAISLDSNPASDAEHKTSFAAVERYLFGHHGLTLDPACKDVSRLAFLAHDPDCYYNPDALPLDVAYWAPPVEPPASQPGAVQAPGEAAESENSAYPHSDAGRAARYCDRWCEEIRYVKDRGIWITWDGHWQHDISGGLMRRAVTMASEILTEAASAPARTKEEFERQSKRVRHAVMWGNLSIIEPMLRLAKTDPSVHCLSGDLDADPFLLGTPNAMVNLRTGEGFTHTRSHLITRYTRAAFDPTATAPRWERFIEEIFPDPELRRYQWKAWGYALTGHTGEKCFHFLIGSGNNGKSKQCEAIQWVLGDYAGHAAKGLLCANDRGSYPLREAATIVGKRLLIGPETEARDRLNVSIIKALTGHGDVMRAANLYENQYDFIPAGKLFIMGNHKPSINDTGAAIWNRVRLIPYERIFTPGEQDRSLGEKLRAEAFGILNWLIQGALLWQAEGLQPPTKVLAAVDAYRREEDTLAEFIEETIEEDPEAVTPHSAIFRRYDDWARDAGIRYPFTKRGLAKALREKQWHSVATKETRTAWKGVALS